MGNGDDQGNVQPDVGQPQTELEHQGTAHQSDGPVETALGSLAPQQPQQYGQITQHKDRAQAMADVNSNPAIAGQLAAQIVGTNMLGDIKSMLKIHALGPPLTLTGRQIGTGNGGVVGCRPGPQGNLGNDQQQTAIQPGSESCQGCR